MADFEIGPTRSPSPSGTTPGAPERYRVALAITADEVAHTQSLRFRVFGEELGAQLHSGQLGIDHDHYDRYCHHLMVQDRIHGEVVGCTRLLTDTQARTAGGFYSETEFDLSAILAVPGRFMEVGRTCVHPEHRNGAIIGLLWQGLARFMNSNRIDYLIGCASIPLDDGGQRAQGLMNLVRTRYLSPEHLRVEPRRPLPGSAGNVVDHRPKMPPLLKAYLRLGGYVCGEPCWDPDFDVADVFILVSVDKITSRYVRHFIRRPERASAHGGTVHAGVVESR